MRDYNKFRPLNDCNKIKMFYSHVIWNTFRNGFNVCKDVKTILNEKKLLLLSNQEIVCLRNYLEGNSERLGDSIQWRYVAWKVG